MKTMNELIYFTKNPQEVLERTALNLRQMIGQRELPLRGLIASVEELVCSAHAMDTLLTVEKKKLNGEVAETFYIFDTGFTFHGTDEPIYGYTLKNTCPHVPQPYFGLYFLRESMLRAELANGPHIADICFGDLAELNQFLNQLAETVVPENWQYKDTHSIISQPVLKNYLEHSFYQLLLEKKLCRNDLEQTVCINTGLLDPFFDEVFLVCDIERVEPAQGLLRERYVNPRILRSSDRRFSTYAPVAPKAAVFCRDKSELIFSCEHREDINLNDRHIFLDNIDRINAGLPAGMPPYTPETIGSCIADFEQGLLHSLALAKQDYKMVAPQYVSETGKIQFLMPIYLSNSCEAAVGTHREMASPNVALCLEKDISGRYIGTTILTLDYAYNNIRLIAKPDSLWADARRAPAAVPTSVRREQPDTEPADTPLRTAMFHYEKSLVNNEDGRIFSMVGYLDGDVSQRAMLRINLLRNGYVTQEEMKRLEALCKAQPIEVRLFEKQDKGWTIGLKGLEVGLDQLVGDAIAADAPTAVEPVEEPTEMADAALSADTAAATEEPSAVKSRAAETFDRLRPFWADAEAAEPQQSPRPDGRAMAAYVGREVEMTSLAVTCRSGLRGTLEGIPYRVNVSPTYLERLGIEPGACCDRPVRVRLTSWDRNAGAFNAELCEPAQFGGMPAPLAMHPQTMGPQFYVGSNGIVETVQCTLRGGLRGTLRGTDYSVCLAPTHLQEMGIDPVTATGPLPVHILRWDENAGALNAALLPLPLAS